MIQLLHGDGEVGAAMVAHPAIPLISFTGSTETGSKVGETCGRMHKRLSLEMGGKNAQIVLDDANLDLALDGVLWGAFGTTGQRCTATSRLILQDGIHDTFLERLVARAKTLVLGDGRTAGTDVGPLIHAESLAKVARYVEIGLAEGATLALGGQRATGAGLAHGFFFQPTILAGVTPTMRVAQEEIFGPVLSVIRVKDAAAAFAVNNSVKYGLSSSVYTQDVNVAFRALQQLDNGITYVNAPTIGAEAHLPFGGVKQTGNGHREGGGRSTSSTRRPRSATSTTAGRCSARRSTTTDAGRDASRARAADAPRGLGDGEVGAARRPPLPADACLPRRGVPHPQRVDGGDAARR